MGCGVAWQVAGVHADAAVEAHEVGHRRMIFHLSRKNFVDTEVRVVVDHLACGLVLDYAIERGFVILAFLGDFVCSSRCAGVLFS